MANTEANDSLGELAKGATADSAAFVAKGYDKCFSGDYYL
jgi:hypothetical protein